MESLEDEERFQMLARRLPVEVVENILISGTRDTRFGKPFGARCMRLASWVQRPIAPHLYRVVELQTENQGASFLLALETEAPYSRISPCQFMESLVIRAPIDVSGWDPVPFRDVCFRILPHLSNGTFQRWESLEIPMLMLGAHNWVGGVAFSIPKSVTVTGVGAISWRAHNWGSLERLRLPSFNPSLQDATWLAGLSHLTHFAFALYYHAPLAIDVVKAITSYEKIKCVVVIIFGQGKEPLHVRKELLKLGESKLVVWQPFKDRVELFESEDVGHFWDCAEAIVVKQTAAQK